MLLTKPLTDYFKKVADKDAFFAPRRLKMAFAGGIIAYGVAAGCGYKMVSTITEREDWRVTDMLSVNAVRNGGPWGIGMVAASYAGDIPLIYAAAGLLYRRRKNGPRAVPGTGENGGFPRDLHSPGL